MMAATEAITCDILRERPRASITGLPYALRVEDLYAAASKLVTKPIRGLEVLPAASLASLLE